MPVRKQVGDRFESVAQFHLQIMNHGKRYGRVRLRGLEAFRSFRQKF